MLRRRHHAQGFGTTVSGSVEWVMIAYLVAIAATLLSVGRLADIARRERVCIAGLALFATGSAD